MAMSLLRSNTAPPSLANVQTFLKAPPPAGSPAAFFASAMGSGLKPGPSPLSSFLTPAPTSMPNVGPVLQKYTPATTGTGTTIPTPSQSSPASTVGGMFSKLLQFGAPAPLPAAFKTSAFQPAPPLSGLNAPPVGTRPRPAGSLLRSPSSLLSPFNPPMSLTVDAVPPSTFLDRPSLPPAQAPMTSASAPVEGSSGTPSTALPAGAAAVVAGVNQNAGPGGGFDPYGGAQLDQGYPYDTGTAAPAPAPAPLDMGKIALYGAAGLGALFVLSRLFKGSN